MLITGGGKHKQIKCFTFYHLAYIMYNLWAGSPPALRFYGDCHSKLTNMRVETV